MVIQNLNAFGQHLEDEGIDYRLILVGDDRSCCRLCVNPPLSASSRAITGPKFLKVEEYIGSTDALDRTLNSAQCTCIQHTTSTIQFASINSTDSHREMWETAEIFLELISDFRFQQNIIHQI